MVLKASAGPAARSAPHGWQQNNPGAQNCPVEAVHLLQHRSQTIFLAEVTQLLTGHCKDTYAVVLLPFI